MNGVKNSSYWSQNSAIVFLGRCYTFQFPESVQADMIGDGFWFGLNSSLTYDIAFHDPNFYLLTSNPLVFPRVLKTLRVIHQHLT